MKADDADGVAKAKSAVLESIKRGVPVQYGSEEDGVIVGHTADGNWIAMHALAGPPGETFVEKKWPWGLCVWPGDTADVVIDRRQIALTALQSAVTMASAPDAGNYAIGANAWAAWLDKLRALNIATDPAEEPKSAQHGNSWLYTCLVEHRTQAALYLRSVSGLFGPVAGQHLQAAADAYHRQATMVLVDPEHSCQQIAPSPWRADWTADMRAEQMKRLEAAHFLEEKALCELRKALAVVNRISEVTSNAPWAGM